MSAAKSVKYKLEADPSGFKAGYAAARKEFGRVWRKHCGKHYPGMALFEVVSLFDPEARIEVQGTAAQ